MKFNGLVRFVAIISIVAVIAVAYVAYRRAVSNEKAREANNAIEAAVKRNAEGETIRAAFDAAMNDETFQKHRATLTARAREAAQHSNEVAKAYLSAVEKVTAATKAAEDDPARNYWSTKQDTLFKRSEAALEMSRSYLIAADDILPDLATVRMRMKPFAERAEAERAEADRLDAEAERHRGRF